jgi:hypothetical protein
MTSALFLDQPCNDFRDSARHGIDLGVKAIDLGIKAIDLGAEPTDFNCEAVDFCVDGIKPAVDGIKPAVNGVKPLIDFLKSLLDILLEADEVEMDLSNDREEKSDLTFHLAHPLFEARNALFKRCRRHGRS